MEARERAVSKRERRLQKRTENFEKAKQAAVAKAIAPLLSEITRLGGELAAAQAGAEAKASARS